MFNPTKMLRLKNAWLSFTSCHPKFPKFLQAVSQSAIQEGTVIEISVTKPDGTSLTSNVKLTASDMQLFHEISNL